MLVEYLVLLVCINHFANFEFTIKDDENMFAIIAFDAGILSMIVLALLETKVNLVKPSPRQKPQHRDLLEKVFHLLLLPSINSVQFYPIVGLRKNRKLAIGTANNCRLPWPRQLVCLVHVVGQLNSEFTEGGARPLSFDRNHELVFLTPGQSLNG